MTHTVCLGVLVIEPGKEAYYRPNCAQAEREGNMAPQSTLTRIIERGRPVVLISCVKTKHDGPCAAKDLYCSTLFKAQREFAEALSKQRFILSAKYKLLHPDQPIRRYEKTLIKASAQERKEWARDVSVALQSQIAASDRIIITAGETYCRYLVPFLESEGHEVWLPLKGLSQGFRPGRLRELAKQARANEASGG